MFLKAPKVCETQLIIPPPGPLPARAPANPPTHPPARLLPPSKQRLPPGSSAMLKACRSSATALLTARSRSSRTSFLSSNSNLCRQAGRQAGKPTGRQAGQACLFWAFHGREGKREGHVERGEVYTWREERGTRGERKKARGTRGGRRRGAGKQAGRQHGREIVGGG